MEIILPLEIINNMPWVWLGIAVVMTVIEGLTMGMTTVWLALAALICMVLAFIMPSATAQIVVFLVLSILMLIFTRPLAVRKMNMGKEKTNADRLIGMNGIVQIPVSADKPGQVKVAGQVWTARPEDPKSVFNSGDQVQVIRIEGVTIIIAKPAE
ncbi:NfeD family protein [Oceanispirochaeta crateris]|uniref:NfeD family protein n=1 Tax=Oceanispirochaeta crateris TaxID=2518645 RepID=A0A5C1QHJ5_9SPIO|nr:NfeD family protein [Oceanispirochaeta crateris]QEN07613.1 NfeD family protein [Oceanispirochaeta crateris]